MKTIFENLKIINTKHFFAQNYFLLILNILAADHCKINVRSINTEEINF